MPKFYDSISSSLADWALSQSVYFIASAPTYGKHVNVSPKGFPSVSFSIMSPNKCAYIDVLGSGNETISHLNENGRATVMFCSFGPLPRILRFYCRGRVIEWEQVPQRQALLEKMGLKEDSTVGARAVIELDVFKVQTSCGFGVPYLGMSQDPQNPDKQIPVLHDRDTLKKQLTKLYAAGLSEKFQLRNNVESLDYQPGPKMSRRLYENVLLWKDAKVGVKNSFVGLWHTAGATGLVAILSSFLTMLALFYLGLLQIPEEHKYRWQEKK